MTEAAHAFLPPSGADRWGPGRCAASPTMEAHYPEDTESPEARQGTAAHFYVTEALSGRTVGNGDVAPNGHPVDAEMIDCGFDFLADVQDVVGSNPGGVLKIESRVVMTTTVHALNWGTPDAYYLHADKRVLYLWDYKYGHRYVDAFRNWQCIDYAIGVFETHGIPRDQWHLWRIVITVAQPRNYHPDGPMREWALTGAQLEEHAVQLRAAAVAATTPGAPMTTGDHCRDCKARHACPALQKVAMGLVDLSLAGQPVDLPPAALGLELRIIRMAMKRLGARAEGLEEQAKALASRGTSVPWWRSEYSNGRTRWNMPVPEVIALGQAYDLDFAKPTAITPIQAIKLGFDRDLIKLFSETPRGAMALVPFDETDIAKRFG